MAFSSTSRCIVPDLIYLVSKRIVEVEIQCLLYTSAIVARKQKDLLLKEGDVSKTYIFITFFGGRLKHFTKTTLHYSLDRVA